MVAPFPPGRHEARDRVSTTLRQLGAPCSHSRRQPGEHEERFVVSATILSVQGALNYGPGRGIFPDYVRVINAIAWIVDGTSSEPTHRT
jgi:hypothetical protein